MKRIGFYNVYTELNRNNHMFNQMNGPIGDDLFACMFEIAKRAKSLDIEVATVEPENYGSFDAYVFMDTPSPWNRFFKYAIASNKPLFLIILESPIINQRNYDVSLHRFFRRVLTYNDTMVNNEKYIKLNYSYTFPSEEQDYIFAKDFFCTLIAGNKMSWHSQELYSERIRTIRWFEKNHPNDFQLFGLGWDAYYFSGPKPVRALNRIRPLTRLLASKYPSYCGPVTRKQDVLRRYKFAICYENTRDVPGYITEKIWDCFFAGCVPIYLGANNVTEHIPSGCFIDRRHFSNYEELYRFLRDMNDSERGKYVTAIKNFIHSDQANLFSAAQSAQTVLSAILDNRR